MSNFGTLLFINGKFVAGEGAVEKAYEPACGTVMAEVRSASAAQIDQAVGALGVVTPLRSDRLLRAWATGASLAAAVFAVLAFVPLVLGIAGIAFVFGKSGRRGRGLPVAIKRPDGTA